VRPPRPHWFWRHLRRCHVSRNFPHGFYLNVRNVELDKIDYSAMQQLYVGLIQILKGVYKYVKTVCCVLWYLLVLVALSV